MDNLDLPAILGIHASSVFNDDGALIFLGPSGTGKTTMCGLLEHRMDVLTKDAIYLVSLFGSWQVVYGDANVQRGTKPVSIEEIMALPHAPLRAIFRLYQSWEPSIERLEILETSRYLVDAFFEIIWQRDEPFSVKAHAFANLAQVARSIPGYTFHFALSTYTLNALNREMKLWEL
ncbi:MAG: hypothetical protein JXA21_16850 [Anaerolineae bacterium]|nr:hypothetical protein [Anaerolineae bacterium]